MGKERRVPMNVDRRWVVLAALAASLLGACAGLRREAVADPPIVFVHGNGDTAGLWITTVWRFESNGWPRDRLHAIDLPYPLARDEDDKPQKGRTSSEEAMRYLAAEVERVRVATHADKVVLMANSRGANTARNYIAFGGGAKFVSKAILGGGTNHGVWANKGFRPTSEFNGAGPLLTALNNQGGPGVEITPGVQWMTIRSDHNDKYAQPDGAWIGAKGTPTNVSFDGPALAGATNVVLPGIDHRETAFGPAAFAAAYEFIAGKPPATTSVVPEARPVLDGVVSGLGYANTRGSYANNLPLAGATVEVWRTDPATGARLGPAVHRKTIGSDGRWGPFAADNGATYEFVIAAPGYATTHIYRSPFPRSSSIVNLHPEHIADADKGARAIATLTRPRGYFGLPEDRIVFDGAPPAGVVPGVAGVSSAKLKLDDAAQRTVVGEFNGERIAGLTWPAADNQTSILELTY
jgi:pimeloyl-ACP methyl ester carboxylesterase